MRNLFHPPRAQGGGEMSKSCIELRITPIPTFPRQGGRSRSMRRLQAANGFETPLRGSQNKRPALPGVS